MEEPDNKHHSDSSSKIQIVLNFTEQTTFLYIYKRKKKQEEKDLNKPNHS